VTSCGITNGVSTKAAGNTAANCAQDAPLAIKGRLMQSHLSMLAGWELLARGTELLTLGRILLLLLRGVARVPALRGIGLLMLWLMFTTVF